jgi:hypothetical protein
MTKFTSAALMAVLSLSVAAPAALVSTAATAASPSEQACIDSGGTYSKDGGQVSCTYTSTSSTGSGGHGQTVTVTDTTTSNGTLNNQPKKGQTDTCDGPGDSLDNSDHCK